MSHNANLASGEDLVVDVCAVLVAAPGSTSTQVLRALHQRTGVGAAVRLAVARGDAHERHVEVSDSLGRCRPRRLLYPGPAPATPTRLAPPRGGELAARRRRLGRRQVDVAHELGVSP